MNDQELAGCARAAVALAEMLCRRVVEPRIQDFPLWDRGLGEVVTQMVRESEIPNRSITPLEIAHAAGLVRRVR